MKYKKLKSSKIYPQFVKKDCLLYALSACLFVILLLNTGKLQPRSAPASNKPSRINFNNSVLSHHRQSNHNVCNALIHLCIAFAWRIFYSKRGEIQHAHAGNKVKPSKFILLHTWNLFFLQNIQTPNLTLQTWHMLSHTSGWKIESLACFCRRIVQGTR